MKYYEMTEIYGKANKTQPTNEHINQFWIPLYNV